jgi:hypothetical protein
MQTHEYDLTVTLVEHEIFVQSHTSAGVDFLLGPFRELRPISAEEFVASIPPGLRVGLLNPETNLFAQLPPTSLH